MENNRFKDFRGRVRNREPHNTSSIIPANVHYQPSSPVHHQNSADLHSQGNTAKKPKKLGLFFGRKWTVIVIVILVAGVGLLAYFYMDTKNQLKEVSNNPDNAAKSEVDKIISDVGKTLKLPSETPTLATVKDVSKLKNQEFFKDAQNGDKVLIYAQSGRALLYRPSSGQVIEYSRVSLNNN